MADTPPFWWQKHSIAGYAMAPFGFIYGFLSARNMARSAGHSVDVPVLCIGNFIVGGAGKTPTAVALAEAAIKMGKTPGFLSRGYGGGITEATIVELSQHNSSDVGDEPLILAKHAMTVICPQRDKGADLLVQSGVDFIIMDDGFQNPSLHKDFNLVVVNSKRGIGNGFVMPAGPLRANIGAQLRRADALLIAGDDNGAASVIRSAARAAKPIYHANIKVLNEDFWYQEILAFAGIADPDKFYASLEGAGGKIKIRRSFHDHHPFSDDEAKEILELAAKEKLMIVTTEKDAARLAHRKGALKKLAGKVKILSIAMVFEDHKMAESVIRKTIAAYKARRLRNLT